MLHLLPLVQLLMKSGNYRCRLNFNLLLFKNNLSFFCVGSSTIQAKRIEWRDQTLWMQSYKANRASRWWPTTTTAHICRRWQSTTLESLPTRIWNRAKSTPIRMHLSNHRCLSLLCQPLRSAKWFATTRHRQRQIRAVPPHNLLSPSRLRRRRQ